MASIKTRERHQSAETDWWLLSLQEAVAPSIPQTGTWEAGLVNMFSGRIAKSCFWCIAMTEVQKSARQIGCTGHLLVGLPQVFDCLVHRGLFSLSGWNSQKMRQEGHKQEGQLIEMWHANSYFSYYTLFSFTDKSHNSLLHELLVGSLNEAHISPESSYVQTLQTCALKRVRSLSAEVGHYMEEEVLKLDITWKKKKKSSEWGSLVKRGLVVF